MAMPIRWVDPNTPLPAAREASDSPPGLVAAGLDLSVQRLEQAYMEGIFPWFNPGEPVLWWSPDPRAVLFCEELHISRTLGKRLRQIENAQKRGDFHPGVVTFDCAFDEVMQACASRNSDDSQATWITPEMKQVYAQWHQLGRAHSVETWIDGQLAGGLYGVSIGKMFFGESMFTYKTDASKIALVHLVRYLQKQGVGMIDCQVTSSHLVSLGAREIKRDIFIEHVHATTCEPDVPWERSWLSPDGQLHRDLPAFISST